MCVWGGYSRGPNKGGEGEGGGAGATTKVVFMLVCAKRKKMCTLGIQELGGDAGTVERLPSATNTSTSTTLLVRRGIPDGRIPFAVSAHGYREFGQMVIFRKGDIFKIDFSVSLGWKSVNI